MNDILDCLIIGAGPAGLSAALYLLRYRRKIMVVDCGESRASLIPKSHNYPGFVKGISGSQLLKRLKDQLYQYKIDINSERIEIIKMEKGIFISNQYIKSKTIILCTGVKDIEPPLPNIENAIRKGLVRHCPVCDAYEVIGKQIGVVCNGKSGVNEALFLRNYSNAIYLLTIGYPLQFSVDEMKQINKAGIKIIKEPIFKVYKLKNRIVSLEFANQRIFFLDTIYSALGCIKNTTLALDLGAKSVGGELIVDHQQQTSIPGFYAAGDIVEGLNQICVAQSQGAIAATAVNDFCSKNSEWKA